MEDINMKIKKNMTINEATDYAENNGYDSVDV